jgi:elongation factor 1-beta
MGTMQIKIKLMPTSPDVDLEKIKADAQAVIEGEKGQHTRFEEEPIAFGLKAVILGFDMPEEQELDPFESKLAKIENVNSVQVIDMRRAFG